MPRAGDVSVLRQELTVVRNSLGSLSNGIMKYIDKRLSRSDNIQLRLLEAVKELKALNSIKKGSRKSKKADVIKHEEYELPFFDIVFSDQAAQTVIELCTVEHIMSNFNSAGSLKGITDGGDFADSRKLSTAAISRKASSAIRIMLFAVNLRNGDSRVLYKIEIGKKHSEYREGIILTALQAAQNNRFNTFQLSTDPFRSIHDDREATLVLKNEKPRAPIWLNRDFLTREDITQARIKLEETSVRKVDAKQKSAEKKSRSDEESKIAADAANALYSWVISRLNAARIASRGGFFDEVGYLFVDWRRWKSSANQQSLKISWLTPDAVPKYNTFADIPDTVVKSDDGSVVHQNKKLLQDLMMDCTDMVLRVQHEVCIRKHAKSGVDRNVKKEAMNEEGTGNEPGNSQSESITDSFRTTDSSTEMEVEKKEMLVRDINLVDISCRFLCCYTSQVLQSPPAQFLSSSKDALRCIFALSMLFKRLIDKVVAAYGKHGLDETVLLDTVKASGINLRAFLPTPTWQSNSIKTKTVHMFPPVFMFRCNTDVIDVQSSVDVDAVGPSQNDARNTRVLDIN